jgi:adenine/guanine phosphoribosyltransferase-like PRPP-binding protein
MIELIRKMGGEVVEAAFIVELVFLNGRKGIDVPIYSIVKYE